MAVTKTIEVDGKEVQVRASAAIPRLYRNKFHRDIYKDLNELQKGIDESVQGMTQTPSAMKSTRKRRTSSTAGRSIQPFIRSFTARNLMRTGLIRRCGKRQIPLSVSRSALTR